MDEKFSLRISRKSLVCWTQLGFQSHPSLKSWSKEKKKKKREKNGWEILTQDFQKKVWSAGHSSDFKAILHLKVDLKKIKAYLAASFFYNPL